MLSWLKLLIKLLLLHLVGCLYYCISDARSHKHQIDISCAWRLNVENSMRSYTRNGVHFMLVLSQLRSVERLCRKIQAKIILRDVNSNNIYIINFIPKWNVLAEPLLSVPGNPVFCETLLGKHWFRWTSIHCLGSLIVAEGVFFLMVCRGCIYLFFGVGKGGRTKKDDFKT